LTVKIAANSDIRVPVQVKVLNSREINAFALPGGFLFVQRGLLEQVDDEAQLAGVMAHELSHAVARHGHRLMKRATIASIIFQAAQVAAMIFTGGVAGIGTYYALQYGFYGLGLVLNLDLLGVSRDFELEADQLGVQYSWKAGYDPTGFVRFFDKLAQREGYVQGLSWFRTHPPFFDRMMKTQEEILYLPKKEALVQQSTAFLRMKERLGKLSEPAEEDRANAPTLKGPEKDCPPVKKIGYKPGQRIEEICDLPMPEMPEKRLREPS
jgi:beta-barrel assembly-enhancing protease